MYLEKFSYQPIPRQTIDGARRYATPDGEKLPSVTTILDATKSEDSKLALANWRRAVGAERAQAITTEAANRGTRMHSFLENYVKNGSIADRPSNPYSWPSHLMAEQIITSGLQNVSEFWGVEIGLYFPKIYAGTTDCCGIHDGDESIIDFKQTNRMKPRKWIEDYFIQLAAYACAHNAVHGTEINHGVIMMVAQDNEVQEFVTCGREFDGYKDKWWRRVEQFEKMAPASLPGPKDASLEDGNC